MRLCSRIYPFAARWQCASIQARAILLFRYAASEGGVDTYPLMTDYFFEPGRPPVPVEAAYSLSPSDT